MTPLQRTPFLQTDVEESPSRAPESLSDLLLGQLVVQLLLVPVSPELPELLVPRTLASSVSECEVK